MIPIEKTASQAKKEFEAHQRKHWLSPENLLDGGHSHAVRLAYFPFWAFQVTATVHYSAKIGTPGDNGSGTVWRQSSAHTIENIATNFCEPSAQVYASYHDRRDLAEGLKASIQECADRMQPVVLPLSQSVLAEQPWCHKADEEVQIQPVEMRLGIAWDLALRSLRHQHEGVVIEQLKSLYGAIEVSDIDMRLQIHSRRTRLLYVPGFVISYTYGEHQRGSLEILQQMHQALVPGSGSGPAVAERHFSPRKSQAASVAAVLGAAAVALVPFAGDGFAVLLTVDTAFLAFLAASVAGVAARGFTGYVRDRHVGRLDERLGDFSTRYMRDGRSAVHMENPHDEWLRNDIEWTRWEETDKWDWQRDKRKAWAERLFQEHHVRRLVKRDTAKRWQEEEVKRRAEAERNARREARFGRSHRRTAFAGGERGGGALDHKGYYKMLGLDAAKHSALSLQDVKKAYRKAALRSHPDVAARRGPEGQKVARANFQRLQTAYRVLKDPKLRKLYDSGAHVDPD